jgi:hypothetical protein
MASKKKAQKPRHIYLQPLEVGVGIGAGTVAYEFAVRYLNFGISYLLITFLIACCAGTIAHIELRKRYPREAFIAGFSAFALPYVGLGPVIFFFGSLTPATWVTLTVLTLLISTAILLGTAYVRQWFGKRHPWLNVIVLGVLLMFFIGLPTLFTLLFSLKYQF